MNRIDPQLNGEWHMAINRHCFPSMTKESEGKDQWLPWMYDAKNMADEIPRIAYWFSLERTGKMPAVHRQCSHSPAQPIVDNHLTCCLGVQCRQCPALLALEKAKVTPEQLDGLKAWTCAAHILYEKRGGHVDDSEGYVKTVGDQMFWETVYDHLGAGL